MDKRVLVADDEQGFRDLFLYILKPLGLDVICVQNGKDAVKRVEEKEYDVVLMDVHMPMLTGLEALEQIHQIRPNQKVIILSSGSDPGHLFEDKAQQQGAIACLYKPVELSVLQVAMEKALGPLPQQL